MTIDKTANKRVQGTLHKVSGPLTRDVGSGNNGNCTANGPSPTLNGKSIDRAEAIWKSEARNSR